MVDQQGAGSGLNVCAHCRLFARGHGMPWQPLRALTCFFIVVFLKYVSTSISCPFLLVSPQCRSEHGC